jgi:hypothetical protein
MLPHSPFRVIAVRADGSHLPLWQGMTSLEAEIAQKSLRQTMAYRQVHIEKNGQRWTHEVPGSAPE